MDKDPSMEDILASIRRIINEDEPPPAPLARPEPVAPAPPPPAEAVLELVEPLPSSAAAVALSGVEATLEGLVREMLKPMLRDWLDTNLPDLVRAEVAAEITRISRRD